MSSQPSMRPDETLKKSLDLLDFIPNGNQLNEMSLVNQKKYSDAQPFAHIQFDNFLPMNVADQILEVFPGEQEASWQKFKNLNERKLANSDEKFIPGPIRNVLYALNGQTFLSFLESLTGIEGLLPDPYFLGGGLHQIPPGGKLGIHIDFNRYERFGLERRLNLLVYLNKDWKEEYGGNLELWDTSGKHCVKRIPPVFNRCVIFNTTETSFHGHPHPVRCPQGNSRKSIALYYYSNGRTDISNQRKHCTVFIPHDSRSWVKHVSRRIFEELTPPIFRRFF